MIVSFLKTCFWLWVLYCLARVLISQRNAVRVDAEVQARCPASFAYQAYMGVRDFYLQLSPSHLKYEMSGPHLAPDTVIDVWEEAGFQLVKHQYRVTELVPGQHMRLVSERSQVRVLGLFNGTSRSEVEFRFAPAGHDACTLGLTICIVFPNAFRQWLARLFFTQAIWQRHAEEEMDALARLVEARYAQGA